MSIHYVVYRTVGICHQMLGGRWSVTRHSVYTSHCELVSVVGERERFVWYVYGYMGQYVVCQFIFPGQRIPIAIPSLLFTFEDTAYTCKTHSQSKVRTQPTEPSNKSHMTPQTSTGEPPVTKIGGSSSACEPPVLDRRRIDELVNVCVCV